MTSLFVEEPLQFLEIESDELGNQHALCHYRGWIILTNKPEEIVRIYLLNLLAVHFTHITFEAENAVRSDISCYMKHPNTIAHFSYKLRPFAIWEIKRIDGPSFSNTLHQMNGYIRANKFMFGAFFYNCREMGHLDPSGKTTQINSIEDLHSILNVFLADSARLLDPIYECFKKAIASNPEDTFNNIVELINELNAANLKYLFKGKPTFHLLVDNEEYFLNNLEFDLESDRLIKYMSPDNYEFCREQNYKLLGIS